MPTRPPRAKTTGSLAPQPRVSARKRGYDTKWEQARRGFLAKHPRCECPAHRGLPTAPLATVVDHHIPHKGDKAAFWTRSNWRALSASCHSIKTGRYDRPGSTRRAQV
jgi:5-methylcytosine-specific restriction enzyme A